MAGIYLDGAGTVVNCTVVGGTVTSTEQSGSFANVGVGIHIANSKGRVVNTVVLAALSASAAGDKGKWPAERVEVKSTLDGTLQPAWFWAPEKAKSEPVPLVVGHHSWSTDIRDLVNYRAPLNAAMTNGWAFVGPSFRGPNRRPEACGSDLAVQDIVGAVENIAK